VTTSARPSAARRGRRGSGLASGPQLEEFHRRLFLALVWRSTWKHGLSKEDAEDVVQEAFRLAVQKLRADGNARAWLIRVVDHLSVNHQRKTLRRARLAAVWKLTWNKENDPPMERQDESWEWIDT